MRFRRLSPTPMMPTDTPIRPMPAFRAYLSRDEWARVRRWVAEGDESAIEVFARYLLSIGRSDAVVAILLSRRTKRTPSEDVAYLRALAGDERVEPAVRQACARAAASLPTER